MDPRTTAIQPIFKAALTLLLDKYFQPWRLVLEQNLSKFDLKLVSLESVKQHNKSMFKNFDIYYIKGNVCMNEFICVRYRRPDIIHWV